MTAHPKFWSPLDLHYSQTNLFYLYQEECFGALWIYTTLKPKDGIDISSKRFGALWIYTTLKQSFHYVQMNSSFGALWIYTTLKLLSHSFKTI